MIGVMLSTGYIEDRPVIMRSVGHPSIYPGSYPSISRSNVILTPLPGFYTLVFT